MYLLVRDEPSRVTLHPDEALDAEDKASLDQRRNPWAVGRKRWIPEPESRAFPKTPDQRSWQEKHKFHPPRVSDLQSMQGTEVLAARLSTGSVITH
jgi:hypothetical protein